MSAIQQAADEVVREIRKAILDQAEAVTATLSRIGSLQLDPEIERRVAEELRTLALTLEKRCYGSSETLGRLSVSLAAFEQRLEQERTV